MAEQTTPPAGRPGLSRQVRVARAAWVVLAIIMSVGAGAVVGGLLWPALGGWALVVQVAVSLGALVAAGWFHDRVVAWLRDYLERERTS